MQADSHDMAAARPLGRSVDNPLDKPTGAIHVYGGDLFTDERGECDPETLAERACNQEKKLRRFQKQKAPPAAVRAWSRRRRPRRKACCAGASPKSCVRPAR